MPNENKIQKDKLCENIFTECTEDFILPDYMPEIRRVVRLESKLLPGESYTGGGKAEFEGTVLYTLFYTDTEEKLTAVPLESHYEYRVPIGAEAPDEVYTDEVLENVNARPSGPRRLNIRSKIRAAVHAVSQEDLQEDAEMQSKTQDYEKLWREGSVLQSSRCRGEEFEAFAEEMLVTEGQEIRPIYSTAEILSESARAFDGHIRCQGTVLIRALAEKGDEIVSLSARIPFEEEIIAAECKEGDFVTVSGHCTRVELETEDDRERHALHAKAYGKMEAVARRNEPFSVVTDLYSTEENIEIVYKPLHTESLLVSYMGNFSMATDHSVPSCHEIPLCSVSLREASINTEDGRAILSGECRADLLCKGDEGFFGTDFSFPFRLEIPLDTVLTRDSISSFSLSPLFAEAVMEGEKCRLSFEMAVKLCVLKKREDQVPAKLTVQSAREETDPDSVTVYYPTDKDSLWSVGKQYGIRTEDLQKQNGIPLDGDTALDSDTSLDGTAWLFVSRL